MSDTVVLTKTASDGRAIEILTDGNYFRARLGGELLPGATTMGKIKPFERNGKTFSHYVGKIALTADEAATAEAGRQAIYETQRAAFLATPAGQLQALIDQRQPLVWAVNAAVEADRSAFEHLHAVEDVRCWTEQGNRQRVIDEAQAALAAFDAAHPEAVAEINARNRREYEQSFVARGLD